MVTTADIALSQHETSIEQSLRKIYDIPDADSRAEQLQATVTHLAQDHPYPLAALLYKLCQQDDDSSDWTQQLLYKLLNDSNLEIFWRKQIETILSKEPRALKNLQHKISATDEQLPKGFNLFAALQANSRSDAVVKFRQHAEYALAAYDAEEMAQACHHLAVAEQYHVTPESSCLHDHWHYLLDNNPQHLAGVIQYCLEQEPLNIASIKLLLIQHYRAGDLNHCLATAAELTRLQPHYAFLALPAVLALRLGKTDRAYEVIYNLLESCVDQPIKENRHMVPALIHWVSYIPWTHRQKAAARSDRKQLEQSLHHEDTEIPRSMLWRIMALLALCHCQQALSCDDREEQLELLQRAAGILRDISPYAWHHAPMIRLQKRLKKHCLRLSRQKKIGHKFLASQTKLQQRMHEANNCLFSEGLVALETEQLLLDERVDRSLQNCLHDFTLALDEMKQSDCFWAQVTAFYCQQLSMATM